MDTPPLISTASALKEQIEKVLMAFNGKSPVQLEDIDEAFEFLSTEMPELVFIDFSDKNLDTFRLLNRIKADPWLLHSGIIAVCDGLEAVKHIEELQGVNIIVILQLGYVDKHLPKVLSIIQNNRRIIFQRGIGADIVHNISGSFKLENNLIEVQCYVNLICNFLFNTGKLSLEKKKNLKLALIEMFLNAVEHGNCGISYDEKTKWLESGKGIGSLIEAKVKVPDIQKRTIAFEYSISKNTSHFTIADQGQGFDWESYLKKLAPENITELHGRGIFMTRYVSDKLNYNKKGNEVSFDINHQDEHTLMPGLFIDMELKEITKGQTIFQQGEASNYLYYIARGTYDVIVNGQSVSTLTPDDIFMGEMSFLLNNRRSATVKARTEGKLIFVSKKQFIESIKQKPHYALFLARLLAQRIQRLNLKATGEHGAPSTIK